MNDKRERETWKAMLARCHCENNPAYRHYGLRGIIVCDRWRFSFESFFADMGPRPDGMSIDRINNDGIYEPGNCRWATPKEQACNRRSTRLITINGESKPLKSWCQEMGACYVTTFTRIKRGWEPLRAILESPHHPGPNTLLLTVNGETLTVKEWSIRSGTNENTIRTRSQRGWDHQSCVFGKKERLRLQTSTTLQ